MSELITYDEWRIALDRAVHAEYEKPEDGGWKKSEQLATEWGKSKTATTMMLSRLVKAGLWEMRSFRVLGGKKFMPTPHYRPIPKKKPSKK